MKCKKCSRDYHFCTSCGVEDYNYDYCSERCLKADGKKVCPICLGWGAGGHDEENDPNYRDDDSWVSCKGYVAAS